MSRNLTTQRPPRRPHRIARRSRAWSAQTKPIDCSEKNRIANALYRPHAGAADGGAVLPSKPISGRTSMPTSRGANRASACRRRTPGRSAPTLSR